MRVLRDYQNDCIAAIRGAMSRKLRRVLVEAATGLGKGTIIALVALMAKQKGGKVLILVNRDVLVQQLMAELSENGMYPQREQADNHASLTCEVVVASVQSAQGSRLKKWPPNHFALVITDEVHFSASKTFRSVLDHFGEAFHIGVTATAERHDKKGLWGGFEDICWRMPLKDWHDKKTGELTRGGIDQGWLCDFDFHDLECPVTLDERLMKKATWEEGEEVFDSSKYLPRLAQEACALSEGFKGLYFLTNCRTSNMFAELVRAQGLECKHVDSSYMAPGETKEILEWFKGARSGILCNAQLLTTGYNNPSIDLIGMLRPVASTALFKQMLGRGTRPVARVDEYPTPELRKMAISQSPKPVCRVVNVFWENGSHDLAQPSCLITDDKDELEDLNKKKKPGATVNLDELQGQLKAKRMADIEEEARKYAEKVANSQRKKIKGSDVYIDDILKRFNPAHKPAPAWAVSKCRKMGATIPDGPLSGYQIFRIMDRLNKAAGLPVRNSVTA